MQRRNFLIHVASLAGALSASLPVAAKTEWPLKPVRIVVPVPPGGSLDTLARTLAKEISPRLNQPVVVDNLPGAGSNIAFAHVAKAAPDGHTLLLGWDSLVINPSLYKTVPYTLQQFAPITLAITSPQVLLVGPKLPVEDLRAFLEATRKAPGRLTLANPGSGSPGHLAGALLESLSGTQFNHVPYKGGAPAVADLAAGHLDAAIVTLPAALAQVRAGRLKALGVSSAHRVSAVPEIPTVAQAGVPGYELNSWQGLLAPAGTPAEVIERLNRLVVEALREKSVREQLVAQGFEIVASSPQALAQELATLTPRWARLVQASGARVD